MRMIDESDRIFRF